jgi:hypothetical protein
MDKTKKAEKETREEETLESTSPVEEQKTQPEVIEEVPETAEKPDETPETPETTEGETEELPEDKSEQGRAFAEMRRKIKDLESEVEEKKARQSSFDQLKQFTPQPQYVQVDPNRFVDTQGNFNQPAYDQAVQQANLHNQTVSRQQAESAVDYKLSEWTARQKHPALNTNRKFERAVASELQARLLETLSDPTKPQPNIAQIADELAPFYAVDQKNVVKKVTAEVKQQMAEKEQASLSASGKSQPSGMSDAEYQNLRKQTRLGNKEAIAERLRRLKS